MTALGIEQINVSLRIATVVAPIALYFFLLGYLNTRNRPQLLTGRQDFALLTIALSPLAISPLLHYLDGGALTLLTIATLVVLAILVFSPRGRTCVIYNLTCEQARSTIVETLARMGHSASITPNGVDLKDGKIVEVTTFPFLRNVTLRLLGGEDAFWMDFENRLHDRLRRVTTEPRPMAVSLLLVATAMIVAPLVLVVEHVPEIVRILTDMV